MTPFFQIVKMKSAFGFRSDGNLPFLTFHINVLVGNKTELAEPLSFELNLRHGWIPSAISSFMHFDLSLVLH